MIDRHTRRARSAGGIFGKAALVAAALALPATAAQASHKVYSPNVTKGEFAIEARGHVDVDDKDSKDGAQRHIYEIEYGLTERWNTALFADLKKTATGSLRYNATAWENVIQLVEKGAYWVDFGVYFEYKFAADDADPDKIEGKLLFERQLGDFRNRLNVNFEEALGSEAEETTEIEYAWQTKWRTHTPVEVGFEAFGKLGEIRDIKPLRKQNHLLGPVLWSELELDERSKIEVQLGWLFGLTEGSPDGTLKWIVEYEIAF